MPNSRSGSVISKGRISRSISNRRSFFRFIITYTILVFFIAQVLLVFQAPFTENALANLTNTPSVSNYYVSPTSGYDYNTFTYYATYTDADGDWPTVMQVEIDGGSRYNMTRYNSTNPKTGLIYQYSTKLSQGTHNFTIVFNDGNGTSDYRTNVSWYPYVMNGTQSTNTYLTNGTVSPYSGNTSTVFTYRVTYSNSFNYTPYWVQVFIDNKVNNMSYISGSNQTGAIYEFTTTLGIGSHNYYFSTQASGDSARYPSNGSLSGPNVFHPGPSLSNGKVTPTTGYPNTNFNYTVTYRNSNNTAPSNPQVFIDDVAYTLSPLSSNYASGVTYWYSIYLSAGQHYYYFKFNADNRTLYLPSSGNTSGPWVDSSLDQLINTSVSPTSGNITTTFTYTLSYYNPASADPISDVEVIIDDTYYNMTKKSGNNTYDYEHKTTLSIGDHVYYFRVKAGTGYFNIPSSGNYTGPMVMDTPPKLSAGMVTPTVGYENTTTFDFTVYYLDLESKAPTQKQVWVNGSYHDMSFVSGSYKTNAKFSYKTTLLAGNYQFHFKFSDGLNTVRLPQTGDLNGPVVSKQGKPLNYPPELSNGTVTPSSGTNKTQFTYSVEYKDKNGDAPSLAQVVIDGDPFNMSAKGGDFLSGKTYEYSTYLSVGDHIYYFSFKDINNSAGWLPSYSTYSGPSVSPPPNLAPELINGSVTPSSGNTSTTFTYRITYKDAEGDIPTLKQVYIDGYPYTMQLSNYNNHKTGAIYEYSTKLNPGNHTYYFKFNDSKNSARYPATGTLSGPKVTKAPGWNNTAPRLTYGRVYPVSGTPQTNFTYYCYYYDADGDKPVMHHVNIDGKLYEMESYYSQNYPTSGYGYYTFSITNLSIGNHTYYFIFSDGFVKVRLPVSGTYSGPVVSTVPSNTKPVLSGGRVIPVNGDTNTNFTYSVSYYDADGGSPTIKLVYIDGKPYVMTQTNSTITGKGANLGFKYNTKLGVGVHYFYFIFSDGTDTIRLPKTGSYYGPPVVKPNTAPVADAGEDQVHTVGPPKTVFFDGSDSYDPDNDRLTFFWDFGDGGYAFGVKTSHIFRGVGTYDVTLTVYDGRLNDTDNCSVKITDSGQGKSQGKAPKKTAPISGYYLTALGASIGASVIVAGVVVASTEWGLYAFLALFLPLYVRLKKEQVLDNFIRGQIYGYIIANPGDHYNSIKSALKLKNGALAYHLKTLEREQLVKSQTDGKFKRFYPFEMNVPPKSTKLTTMRKNIVEKINEEPGITQHDISEKMGVSHQAISYHLRTLVQLGAVKVEKNGRANYCYPGDNTGLLQHPDEERQEWT